MFFQQEVQNTVELWDSLWKHLQPLHVASE